MLTVDRDIEGFLMSIITSQGYLLSIGGFCVKNLAELQKRKFRTLIDLKYPNTIGAYQVDALLADKVKEYAIPSLFLIGASIKIPHLNFNTGGILGDPHASVNSANGNIEILKNNFSQLTLPGGPGVAIQGKKSTLNKISNAFTSLNENNAKKRFNTAKRILEEDKINQYIIVSDGCGPSCYSHVELSAFIIK